MIKKEVLSSAVFIDVSQYRDGDTLRQISKDFKYNRSKALKRKSKPTEDFAMYVRLVLVCRRDKISFREVTGRFPALHLGRTKMSAVSDFLDEDADLSKLELPKEFHIGRYGSGQLSRAQKFQVFHDI